MHVTASLFELQGGGASFVPTEAIGEVQGAVAGHPASGREARGALWVAQGVTLCGETASCKQFFSELQISVTEFHLLCSLMEPEGT